MIVMHNFNEAYQMYRQGRIPFRLIQDQAAVLIGLCQAKHPGVADALAITPADNDWLLQQPEAAMDYSDYLGGYMHACETEADLLEIHGCDFDFADAHDGRWPNVTDMALGWDACDYLKESSGEPEWVLFLLCWNDAGGAVYFVPKSLWLQARVEEHIKETSQAWA